MNLMNGYIKSLGYKTIRSIPSSIRSPAVRVARRIGDWCSKTAYQWHSNAVFVYWYRGSINFGDLLTPSLMKYYGFLPCYSARPIKEAGKSNDIVGIGSILGRVHHEFKGIILGSGTMFNEPRVLPNALFLAVRGELTKKLYQCSDSTVLGDPGLLADRLLTSIPPKKYRLGICLHESELDHELHIGKFDTDTNTKIIDPRRYPGDVLRDIAECEYIASSSLHGLIVADSFGIPCARILLSEGLISGGDVKFDDYDSSIGIRRNKLVITDKVATDYLIDHTTTPPKEILFQRKNDLHNLFTGLKALLANRRQESNH